MTTLTPQQESDFHRDFARFGALSRAGGAERFALAWDDRLPCPADATATTGFDRHYVYHTAWAARQLARLRPDRHVDIASSLYFAAIASAFVPVDHYDYRPPDVRLANLTSSRADLGALPFPDASIPSLSCMHVVEHVGLGRYGDPLDPAADLRAMSELARVLAAGGHLLFVVPVGHPRIQFNAHRIYAFAQVQGAFAQHGLTLEEFALVPDRSDPGGPALIPHATEQQAGRQRYGCGCYLFRRPA